MDELINTKLSENICRLKEHHFFSIRKKIISLMRFNVNIENPDEEKNIQNLR